MFKSGAWKSLILREGLNHLAECGSRSFLKQASDWKARIQKAVIDRYESDPSLAIQQLKEINAAFDQVEEIREMIDRVTNGEAKESLSQIIQTGRCLFHDECFLSALMCFEVAIRASEPNQELCLMAAEAAAKANRRATKDFYLALSEKLPLGRDVEEESALAGSSPVSQALVRRWIRKNVEIPVLISTEKKTAKANVISLSAGGGLIELESEPSQLQKADVFSFQMLEAFEAPIHGKAKKIYELNSTQFGFCFLNLARENRDQIDRWILGADLKTLFA
jgi:hypothetical protein